MNEPREVAPEQPEAVRQRPGADGLFDGASAARVAALTVRFLVELALLAAVGGLAWRAVPGGWRWPAMVLAVVAVATVWGLFLSPKASIAVPAPVALGIETVLFSGTAAGLAATRLGLLAVAGFAVWLLDRVALRLLPADP